MASSKSFIKHPSAWLPIAMSLTALALVVSYLVVLVFLSSKQPQEDEGTAAHVWQLLMAGQVPIIAFFAIKYLPLEPKQALLVLSIQASAALIACAPVFLLEL